MWGVDLTHRLRSIFRGKRVTWRQSATLQPQWLSCCKWRGSSNQDWPGSVSAPLSYAVWNDQWAKIKWSQAKIGLLMKMDCLNILLGERPTGDGTEQQFRVAGIYRSCWHHGCLHVFLVILCCKCRITLKKTTNMFIATSVKELVHRT